MPTFFISQHLQPPWVVALAHLPPSPEDSPPKPPPQFQGLQPSPLHLKQFQANAKKSSLPKSAKLVVLILSLDCSIQGLPPWSYTSASVSDMMQRLLQAAGGNLVTSTQPLLLKAPPMLNCLQGQQEPATSQGPLSSEVSQSLVSPASPLAIAPLSSLSLQGIPTLAALSFYEIDGSCHE
ncbi:hypothetical protein DSO57_1022428 [Entomophthora muscae]|uniref:Uncharacterized protein n=1 Tax=Entomophthora muscae TaxID=34485 RepID=A0ACC2RUD3_9FUNG|nr:hypothetical protein DSO57_1022428 [Entomophthora muscae]